jgi:hypothetical protein
MSPASWPSIREQTGYSRNRSDISRGRCHRNSRRALPSAIGASRFFSRSWRTRVNRAVALARSGAALPSKARDHSHRHMAQQHCARRARCLRATPIALLSGPMIDSGNFQLDEPAGCAASTKKRSVSVFV